MSSQYKNGKPFEPKSKAPKRKDAKELVAEHNIALLLEKLNLMKQNIADDFLEDRARNQKIIERAIDLATLHPFEMLIKLASTELHLETTMFLYQETYKQKQFLEAAYIKSGKKRLVKAINISKGKLSPAYIVAKELLDSMQEKNFKIFCKKMRARLSNMDLPASSLRNYYLKITGKKSTK